MKEDPSQFLDSLNNFNQNYEKIKNKLDLYQESKKRLDNYNGSSSNYHKYSIDNPTSIAGTKKNQSLIIFQIISNQMGINYVATIKVISVIII
jgi:hypothetical protein